MKKIMIIALLLCGCATDYEEMLDVFESAASGLYPPVSVIRSCDPGEGRELCGINKTSVEIPFKTYNEETGYCEIRVLKISSLPAGSVINRRFLLSHSHLEYIQDGVECDLPEPEAI